MLYLNIYHFIINLIFLRYLEAIIDCYAAIEDDSTYTRSYQRRADAYAALGDYSAAIQDLETLIRMSDSCCVPEVKIQISELQRKITHGQQLIDVYKVINLKSCDILIILNLDPWHRK